MHLVASLELYTQSPQYEISFLWEFTIDDWDKWSVNMCECMQNSLNLYNFKRQKTWSSNYVLLEELSDAVWYVRLVDDPIDALIKCFPRQMLELLAASTCDGCLQRTKRA